MDEPFVALPEGYPMSRQGTLFIDPPYLYAVFIFVQVTYAIDVSRPSAKFSLEAGRLDYGA